MRRTAGALAIGATSIAALGLAASPASANDLDAAFGYGGLAPVVLSSTTADRLNAVANAPGGGYYAAGYVDVAGDQQFAVAKIGADGTRDTSFGAGGVATINIAPGNEAAQGIGVQSDGRIVVGSGVANDVWVARFNTDGSVDTSFDGDGKVQIDLSPGTIDAGAGSAVQDAAWGLEVAADDKIVIEGRRGTRAQGDPGDNGSDKVDGSLAAIRLLPGGGRDTSFGTGTDQTGSGGDDLRGVVLIDLRVDPTTFLPSTAPGAVQITENARQLTIADDGEIVLGSYGSPLGVADAPVVPVVARISPAGVPVASFGQNGAASGPVFPPEAGANASVAEAYQAAKQSDGKVVMTGYGSPKGQTFRDQIVARFTTTGALDTTFGTGGRAQYAPGGTEDRGRALTVQDDDRILVAGSRIVGGDQDALVVRYDKDGAVDTSFGDGGIVAASLGGRASAFFGARLSADGKTAAFAGWDGRALSGVNATANDNGLVARITTAAVADPVGPTTTVTVPGPATTVPGPATTVPGPTVTVPAATTPAAAPVARSSIRNRRVYAKGKGPRRLSGTVSSSRNVAKVTVKLTRGSGRSARTYSPSRGAFTGSRTAKGFAVAYADGRWTLDLARRLGRGSYTFDVVAHGRDGKAQPIRSGTNRIAITVR